jgi:hypothetical protein
MVFLLLAFPPKPYIHSSSLPCVVHALPIWSTLTDHLITKYSANSTSYEAPPLCSFLWPPIVSSSFRPIFFSATCTQSPSINVLPLMSKIKFHAHTKLQAKSHICIFYVGFEVLAEVVIKSTIFWDITPCSPLKVNRRFGEIYHLHLQGRIISRVRSQRDSSRLCLPPAYSSTLKMGATCSSVTSVDFQRTTRRYIPEESSLLLYILIAYIFTQQMKFLVTSLVHTTQRWRWRQCVSFNHR